MSLPTSLSEKTTFPTLPTIRFFDGVKYAGTGSGPLSIMQGYFNTIEELFCLGTTYIIAEQSPLPAEHYIAEWRETDTSKASMIAKVVIFVTLTSFFILATVFASIYFAIPLGIIGFFFACKIYSHFSHKFDPNEGFERYRQFFSSEAFSNKLAETSSRDWKESLEMCDFSTSEDISKAIDCFQTLTNFYAYWNGFLNLRSDREKIGFYHVPEMAQTKETNRQIKNAIVDIQRQLSELRTIVTDSKSEFKMTLSSIEKTFHEDLALRKDLENDELQDSPFYERIQSSWRFISAAKKVLGTSADVKGLVNLIAEIFAPVGIQNIGSSCYLNTFLQMVFHSKYLNNLVNSAPEGAKYVDILSEKRKLQRQVQTIITRQREFLYCTEALRILLKMKFSGLREVQIQTDNEMAWILNETGKRNITNLTIELFIRLQKLSPDLLEELLELHSYMLEINKKSRKNLEFTDEDKKIFDVLRSFENKRILPLIPDGLDKQLQEYNKSYQDEKWLKILGHLIMSINYEINDLTKWSPMWSALKEVLGQMGDSVESSKLGDLRQALFDAEVLQGGLFSQNDTSEIMGAFLDGLNVKNKLVTRTASVDGTRTLPATYSEVGLLLIDLPEGPAISFKALMASYFAEDEDISYTFEGDSEASPIQRSSKLIAKEGQAPREIYISLKRYKQMEDWKKQVRLTKINTSSDLAPDEIVDMSDYFEPTAEGVVKARYKLRSVAIHEGTVDFGHYYAVVKVGKNWYETNDSRVTLLNDIELRRKIKQGYVFILEKIDE